MVIVGLFVSSICNSKQNNINYDGFAKTNNLLKLITFINLKIINDQKFKLGSIQKSLIV